MLRGKTLVELATEIERQSASKSDLLAQSDALSVGIAHANVPVMHVGEKHSFGVNEVAHGQLATYTGIPKAYYDTLRASAPALYTENVNHWLGQRTGERRMVRTLDGNVRALLSPGYRSLDNADLLEAVLPAAHEAGLQILSSNVTDTRMYLQMTTSRLRGEVKVGDEVQAGLVISNSEVGAGALNVEWLIYRLVCLNGMIVGKALRKNHIGRRVTGLEDEVQAYYADSTRRLDDAAFFSKVRDTVRHMLTPEGFESKLAELRGSTERKIEGDPVVAVEKFQRRLGLTDGERGGLLTHLIEGGDLSAWGVANAVTALAHDAESYDRSVELERAGSTVIDLPRSEWKTLAQAA